MDPSVVIKKMKLKKKKLDAAKKKKAVQVEIEEEEDEEESPDIFLVLKFANYQIDDVADSNNLCAMLKEHNINYKFDKQCKDQFVSFDARQFYNCVRDHLNKEIDLHY